MTHYYKTTKNIDKDNISVVILCGGKGTRLQEETSIIPKPLVQIGSKPILWHIMKIYSTYGFNNFILPIGYKGEKIKEYFAHFHILNNNFTAIIDDNNLNIKLENKINEKWTVKIIDTGIETQTGTRIKKIEQYIPGDNFMVTYGDGVANVNINKLFSFFLKEKKLGIITGVKPSARFGQLISKGNVVKKFQDKTQVKSNYIDGGFFVFNKKILKYFTDNDNLSLEKDILPLLSRKNQLSVFKHNGYWQCMDTMRDVEFLNEEWNSGRAEWKVW